MVKVYTPEGIEEERDAVDARECVAHCGYRYEPPAVRDTTKASRGKHAKTIDSAAVATDDAEPAAVADGDAANGAASNHDEAGG